MAGEPQWLLTRRVEAAIRKLGVYAQNCQSRSPGDGSELRLRLDACWAALRGELDIASEAMRLLSSEIPALEEAGAVGSLCRALRLLERIPAACTPFDLHELALLLSACFKLAISDLRRSGVPGVLPVEAALSLQVEEMRKFSYAHVDALDALSSLSHVKQAAEGIS